MLDSNHNAIFWLDIADYCWRHTTIYKWEGWEIVHQPVENNGHGKSQDENSDNCAAAANELKLLNCYKLLQKYNQLVRLLVPPAN